MSDSCSTGSISIWLHEFQAGSRNPIRHLLQRYLPRLVGLAISRLRDEPQLLGYAEDIASGVFHQFCLGIERGRFDAVADRKSLWQLLAVMTVRRTIDLKRKARREEQFAGETASIVSSREPTPDIKAEAHDDVRQLLESLNDADLKQIALLKMSGCENEEIAAQLGCGLRTVERRLERIRQHWRTELRSDR